MYLAYWSLVVSSWNVRGHALQGRGQTRSLIGRLTTRSVERQHQEYWPDGLRGHVNAHPSESLSCWTAASENVNGWRHEASVVTEVVP